MQDFRIHPNFLGYQLYMFSDSTKGLDNPGQRKITDDRVPFGTTLVAVVRSKCEREKVHPHQRAKDD